MSKKGSTTTCDYLEFDSCLNKALKVLKNEKRYKLAFLIVVGINLGIRISDLLRLKFEDLENDEITIIEGKTKKKRTLQFNPNIIKAFNVYKERSKIREGFLFISNQGKVLTKQYINRALKLFFGKSNLNISSHSLRKTFGRRVWESHNKTDEALMYLSEIFNHSSIAITRKYLGIRKEQIKEIYMSLSV